MVMFHSYVSLPEGIPFSILRHVFSNPQCYCCTYTSLSFFSLELTLSLNSKQPVFHFNPFKNRAFANPRFQHRFLPASRHHMSILLVVVGGSSNKQLTTTFQQWSKAKPSYLGLPPWGMLSEPSRETM